VDRGLGLIRRFAGCFCDRRDPRYVEHQVETMVGQRIFGLVLGYEDLNDHDELRKDPIFTTLAGKLAPVLRSDCEALAGKSTLNRVEHTPKRHGAKYHKIDCDQAQVDRLLVDLFLEAHERAPREIVLDLDNTDIPLHGMQEGRFFHGYGACPRAGLAGPVGRVLLSAALCVLRPALAAGPAAACERRRQRGGGRGGGTHHCADPPDVAARAHNPASRQRLLQRQDDARYARFAIA
jgi:hypothetical protein